MPLVQTESVPDSSQPAADATATATRGIRIEEVEEGQSAGAEGGKAWVGVTADQARTPSQGPKTLHVRGLLRATPSPRIREMLVSCQASNTIKMLALSLALRHSG